MLFVVVALDPASGGLLGKLAIASAFAFGIGAFWAFVIGYVVDAFGSGGFRLCHSVACS